MYLRNTFLFAILLYYYFIIILLLALLAQGSPIIYDDYDSRLDYNQSVCLVIMTG